MHPHGKAYGRPSAPPTVPSTVCYLADLRGVEEQRYKNLASSEFALLLCAAAPVPARNIPQNANSFQNENRPTRRVGYHKRSIPVVNPPEFYHQT